MFVLFALDTPQLPRNTSFAVYSSARVHQKLTLDTCPESRLLGRMIMAPFRVPLPKGLNEFAD